MKMGKLVKDRKNRLVFNYNNKNYTYDEIYNLNWDPRDIIDEYCILGEDYD